MYIFVNTLVNIHDKYLDINNIEILRVMQTEILVHTNISTEETTA